jgi:hypothetical protein
MNKNTVHIYKYSRCGLHVVGFNNSRFGVIFLRHAARLIAHLSLLNPTLLICDDDTRFDEKSCSPLQLELPCYHQDPQTALRTPNVQRWAFHTTEVGLGVRLERHRARK